VDINDRLEQIKKQQTSRKNSISRVEGRASQDKAKKLLNIPDSPLGKDSDEEFWNTDKLRFEVKSGKQVNDTVLKFEKAETQSWEFELSKNDLDKQKDLFSMVMMPHGTNDGLFLCRLSQLQEIVKELNNIWKQEENNG
jgi:hypothetical protein